MHKTIEAAWQRYLDDSERMRQKFLRDPMCAKYPALVANAHFVLQQTQALAYNLVMAPRQDSPVFTTHHYFEPLIYTAHQPNPDFVYQAAFMNGARRWRLKGRRHSARWVDIQVSRGWWGEPGYDGIGNYDLDDFEIGDDGTFEIVASADRCEGNWIRLDRDHRNNAVMVRPAMYDWDVEVPPEFYVEPLDDDGVSGPAILDATEIVRRLGLCGEFVKHSIGRWTTRGSPRLLELAGMNQFMTQRGDASRGGANPLAQYGQAVYELAADEALIVETAHPDAAYWGISLGTWWWETTDPMHHKTSINGYQAVLDDDGQFRAVISRVDPGVPNWLDTAGWDVGIALLRWYRASQEQAVRTTKVPLADVRRHLPAGTAHVTAQQRRGEIARRRHAFRRWYGYEQHA